MNFETRVQLNESQLKLLEKLLQTYINCSVTDNHCHVCESFLGVKISQGCKLTGKHMEGCPVTEAQYLLELFTRPEPRTLTEGVKWAVIEWLAKRKTA